MKKSSTTLARSTVLIFSAKTSCGWLIKDGKLYTARVGSETQVLDRAQLLARGQSTIITMDKKDRVSAGLDNPVGYKTDWIRIGY